MTDCDSPRVTSNDSNLEGSQPEQVVTGLRDVGCVDAVVVGIAVVVVLFDVCQVGDELLTRYLQQIQRISLLLVTHKHSVSI